MKVFLQIVVPLLIFTSCLVNDVTNVFIKEDVKKIDPIDSLSKCVPDYFMEQLLAKEEMISEKISSPHDNTFSLIFFTDAHWDENQKHTPSIIAHLVATTGIKDIIFGGDVITHHSDDKLSALNLGLDFQDAFRPFFPNFYCVYGNHDNNSDGQPKSLDLHLTEDEVFCYLQSQMTAANLKYGEPYNFYIDYEESQTRLVCLDTGRFYYASSYNKLPNTIQFVISTLSTVPDGWHIIIASHTWCGLENIEGIRECVIRPIIQNLLSVLDDYNLRISGEYVYGKEHISYDFSKSKAEIIACIGGHNHRDAILYSTGGIPIIIVTTDSQQTINKTTAYTGTINEQAISTFVFDYNDRIIYEYRVGRGNDRTIKF